MQDRVREVQRRHGSSFPIRSSILFFVIVLAMVPGGTGFPHCASALDMASPLGTVPAFQSRPVLLAAARPPQSLAHSEPTGVRLHWTTSHRLPLAESATWSLPVLVTSGEFNFAFDRSPEDSFLADRPEQHSRIQPPHPSAWQADIAVTRVSPSARVSVKDSGSAGLRAELFRGNEIEINPDWLDFTQFDSLNMSMADTPTGPSDARPQLWRSTFTIGLGSDCDLSPTLAWHLGYRYYDNAMPDAIPSGALPSANQHVVATGLTYHRGAHALTLCYGVDLYDPAAGFDSSTQRAGVNTGTTAHIVSLTYRHSF